MQNKVLLILCDGMRPDAVIKCGHPFAEKLMSTVPYNPHAQTVFPSWTLPCHFSLFKSRTPDEHGIMGNTYVPEDYKGLFEQLKDNGKCTSIFYSWGELKDLYKPYSLCYGGFVSEEYFPHGKTTELLEAECENFIAEYNPDLHSSILKPPTASATKSVGEPKNTIKPHIIPLASLKKSCRPCRKIIP